MEEYSKINPENETSFFRVDVLYRSGYWLEAHEELKQYIEKHDAPERNTIKAKMLLAKTYLNFESLYQARLIIESVTETVQTYFKDDFQITMKFLFLKAKYQMRMYFIADAQKTVISIRELLKPHKRFDKHLRLILIANVVFYSEDQIVLEFQKAAKEMKESIKDEYSVDFLH